jgi:hypothetical protein
MELRLLDKANAVQRSWRIQAEASRRAAGTGHEAQTFVVPQGVAAQPTVRGQLTNSKGSWLVHTSVLSIHPGAHSRVKICVANNTPLDSGARSRGDTARRGLLMTSCCCPGKADEGSTSRCPASGSHGAAVDLLTVKALLSERALQRLLPGEYRFCSDASCDVVYFSADGDRFTTADVRVPVWQKLPFGDRLICYCFGESEASIRSELESAAASSAVERIRHHIDAERCACEVRNPRGACCLGDVIAAVKRVAASVAPARVVR